MIRADPTFGPRSLAALDRASSRGVLVACDVVWGEVAFIFDDAAQAGDVLDGLGVGFSPMSRSAALRAGRTWRAYRRAGGRRDRFVADVLVAGHATEQADVLLTRDRGFVRAHFGGLVVEDPSAPN